MKHQLKQAFSSSKFVLGFVLFSIMLLLAIFYPIFSPFDPMEMVGSIFYPPGTYVSVSDTVQATYNGFNIDPSEAHLKAALSPENREKMKNWLVRFGGVNEADIDIEDTVALVDLWDAHYSSDNPQEGLLSSEKKSYSRLDKSLAKAKTGIKTALYTENSDGEMEESLIISDRDYVRVNDVANTVTLPLGADNFGADMLTKLTNSIRVSLQIGLVAGLIATLIGLTIGLLAGFLGGLVDNILTFLTNIFTVIPSFVILILIANSVGQAGRGPFVVAMIIGVTAWPWTARSVRSQVISLRNRDHVNLSKLSGHSLPHIILNDILPYVASYVVMALILQVSSGILAEAQLSMLGLGPSTTTTTTLGMMMNWAQQYTAHLSGAWWAFIPVILSVAIISFSLNLMNTGLDQIFNPQLRED